nr:MAG TPA: Membrane MotB of proton-channel complex MotA/MotB [Caudoviricetes sp.]DAZ26731.1 MAG TPA: Membrane MotB of proton-channel complex MotA/MotB [Caudoviricetes sp.]
MPYLNTAQLYTARQTRVRIDSYFDFIHLFTSLFVVLFLFV